jgi:hypothetical protein
MATSVSTEALLSRRHVGVPIAANPVPLKRVSVSELTGITLSAGGGADLVYAGDTALSGGAALGYGDPITSGSLRCDSTPSGIECRDA